MSSWGRCICRGVGVYCPWVRRWARRGEGEGEGERLLLLLLLRLLLCRGSSSRSSSHSRSSSRIRSSRCVALLVKVGEVFIILCSKILNPLLSSHIIRDCADGGIVLAFSRGKCVVFRAREETGRRQRRRRTKTARQHPTRWSGEVDGNMVGYYHLSLLTL